MGEGSGQAAQTKRCWDPASRVTRHLQPGVVERAEVQEAQRCCMFGMKGEFCEVKEGSLGARNKRPKRVHKRRRPRRQGGRQASELNTLKQTGDLNPDGLGTEFLLLTIGLSCLPKS